MSTRKVKDAKDTKTKEMIYFKGHAKATYMSDGINVEDAINELREGPGADMMLDGYIPLSRDFNDDFNDDFAR